MTFCFRLGIFEFSVATSCFRIQHVRIMLRRWIRKGDGACVFLWCTRYQAIHTSTGTRVNATIALLKNYNGRLSSKAWRCCISDFLCSVSVSLVPTLDGNVKTISYSHVYISVHYISEQRGVLIFENVWRFVGEKCTKNEKLKNGEMCVIKTK